MTPGCLHHARGGMIAGRKARASRLTEVDIPEFCECINVEMLRLRLSRSFLNDHVVGKAEMSPLRPASRYSGRHDPYSFFVISTEAQRSGDLSPRPDVRFSP